MAALVIVTVIFLLRRQFSKLADQAEKAYPGPRE
jgi:hypothetical protein